MDTHTHMDTQTDAGNDNTRRPKLTSGKTASENVICEMASDLSQPQCVNEMNKKKEKEQTTIMP